MSDTLHWLEVAVLDELARHTYGGIDWPHPLAHRFKQIDGGDSTRPRDPGACRLWWMAYTLGRHGLYSTRSRYALDAAALTFGGLVRACNGQVSVADLGCGG